MNILREINGFSLTMHKNYNWFNRNRISISLSLSGSTFNFSHSTSTLAKVRHAALLPHQFQCFLTFLNEVAKVKLHNSDQSASTVAVNKYLTDTVCLCIYRYICTFYYTMEDSRTTHTLKSIATSLVIISVTRAIIFINPSLHFFIQPIYSSVCSLLCAQ